MRTQSSAPEALREQFLHAAWSILLLRVWIFLCGTVVFVLLLGAHAGGGDLSGDILGPAAIVAGIATATLLAGRYRRASLLPPQRPVRGETR